jgi:drug/metabolite transporter (DMT)-like permease
MHLVGNLFATATALFWASAVIMFKKSGETLSPTSLNLFKGVVTLVFLLPTLWLAGIPIFPDYRFNDWVLLGLSGFLGITLADNLFFMALQRIGAGLWAVVECLYLPVVILLSAIFLNESIGFKGWVGALLVSTAIITGSVSKEPIAGPKKQLSMGIVCGVSATCLMAASIVLIKPLLVQTSVLWASFVRILVGVSGLLVMAVISPDRCKIIGTLKPSSAWKLALPASIVGNYLAMLAWLAGYKYTLVSVAAILNQLSTIFTFILAAIFLKEPVTSKRLIAIVLAVIGALFAATV